MPSEPERPQPPLPPARRVSVVVPTLNEAGNIDELLGGLLEVGRAAGLDFEILIVDDGSTDSTAERVRAWTAGHPVRLLQRDATDGLAGAVLAGAAAATAGVVVVMDADLSHPADRLPELVRPVLAGRADMVVGSRYVPGGATEGWPLGRRLGSAAATALARLLVDVRDPLAGFFAVRREVFLEAGKGARGFKIALEVLARGGGKLRVEEVPITFRDRTAGSSKMRPAVLREYLLQLLRLAGATVPAARAARFGLAGLTAWMVPDLSVFLALLAAGTGAGTAHFAAFLTAAAVYHVICARAVKRERDRFPRLSHGRLLALALMGLFFRGGVFAFCQHTWGWPPALAILPASLTAAAILHLGAPFYVFRGGALGQGVSGWRVAAVATAAYLVLLRLLFLGGIELLPEEAYYWNYSQHLDLSYLDHPPLVAWLIRVGTALLGQGELGVRLGAVVCWLVAAVFSYLLARDLFDRSVAFGAVLLLAVLPYFFGAGWLMTPDAPLVASWAAALYFFERALLRGQRLAWWGAGAALGMGLLSKYTILLAALAALAFTAADRRSRRWLRAPEPYAATLLAVLLFFPVLWWNAQHDWASFLFQGPGRLRKAAEFQLHLVALYALLLVTPLGLVGFAQRLCEPAPSEAARRRCLFLIAFTLVPLAVFAAHSLRAETKINWTGPVWLAALPAMAASMAPGASRWSRLLARAWQPLVVALVIAYGAMLHYPALGFPGVHLSLGYYTMDWRDLARQIESIEREVAAETGQDPLLVGTDKYHISSELAFYDPERDGVRTAAGRHLFGRSSLMYEYWFPRAEQRGRPLIAVSHEPEGLSRSFVTRQGERVGPVRELVIRRHGRVLERYYCRVIYGYRGDLVARGGGEEG